MFCECKKCGYFWKKRINNPKTCPSCRSKKWDFDNPKVYSSSLDIVKIKSELSMKYARIAAENMLNMYKSDHDYEEAIDYLINTFKKLTKRKI